MENVKLSNQSVSVKAAIVPVHATRKAASRTLLRDGNFFTIMDIKNPNQLYAVLDTAKVFLYDATGKKYYEATMENVVDLFAAILKGGAIDPAKFTKVDNVEKTIGYRDLVSFVELNSDTDSVKYQLDLTVEAGVIYGGLLYVSDKVEASETYKTGYFVSLKFDKTAATAAKFTDVKFIVNNKFTIDAKNGVNVIGLGEEPESLTIQGKFTMDGKDITRVEKFKIRTFCFPKEVSEAVKPFKTHWVYPEKDPSIKKTVVTPTPANGHENTPHAAEGSHTSEEHHTTETHTESRAAAVEGESL